MANAEWPASLPQGVTVSGYDETPPDGVLRTQMDVGPDKTRPRNTAEVRKFTLRTPPLTQAQLETLDTFFVTTLARGALPFDWVHPRTGAEATFMFKAPPRYQASSRGSRWAAIMQVELQP
jgi:hypothetical protein